MGANGRTFWMTAIVDLSSLLRHLDWWNWDICRSCGLYCWWGPADFCERCMQNDNNSKLGTSRNFFACMYISFAFTTIWKDMCQSILVIQYLSFVTYLRAFISLCTFRQFCTCGICTNSFFTLYAFRDLTSHWKIPAYWQIWSEWWKHPSRHMCLCWTCIENGLDL